MLSTPRAMPRHQNCSLLDRQPAFLHQQHKGRLKSSHLVDSSTPLSDCSQHEIKFRWLLVIAFDIESFEL